MRYSNLSNYRHGSTPRLAVLLVNLGTPTQATSAAVRKFLRKFLSDPRVVEIPRPLWRLILHLFILPFRPRKVAAMYRKIWTDQGSPLLVEALKQVAELDAKLNRDADAKLNQDADANADNNADNNGGAGDDGAKIIVRAAMCYSAPTIEDAIASFQRQNVRRLLILPMYPQYSATTTAAVFDLATKTLHRYRWLPEFRFIADYYDHPLYIEACAQQILAARVAAGKNADKTDSQRKLIFSFHGLPKANLLKGDPYHCHCHTTARLIAERLELADEDWMITFQSRFGKAEWLQPYTDKTLHALPAQGVQDVDVFCPGFAVDCLETLEEIAMQNKKIFLEAGGKNFRYIPALNSSPAHIEFLAELIGQHIQNWHDADNDQARQLARARALALGAED